MDEFQNLHRAIQSIPLGVTIINLDGIITYTNSADAEMHGYTADEIIGKSSRLYAPERLWHVFNQHAVAEWNGLVRESTNIKKDGTEFPVYLTSEVIRDRHGEPSSIITICEDITTKKKLERELIKLQMAIETTEVGITITDSQGCIVYINNADVKMHGYDSPLELIGKRANILAPEYTRHDDHRSIENKQEFPTWRRETENITKDSIIFPVEVISNPIYDQNGIFIGRVATCTNIEERKSLEDTLKFNEERLESLLAISQIEGSTEKDIANYVLEEAVRLTRSEIGYLHFIHKDQKTIQLYTWSESVLQECTTVSGSHYPLDHAGIWADCVRKRIPVSHNDYDSLGRELPEGHIKLIRHMSIPIFDNDRIVAVIGVGNKISMYTGLDMRQLSLFGREMWSIFKKNRVDAKIRSQQRLLHTIFDTIPDPLYVKDRRRCMILVNTPMMELFGVSKKRSILGKRDEELYVNFKSHVDDDLHVLSTGESIVNVERYMTNPKTGKNIHLLMSKLPLLSEHKEIVGIVGFSKDITELKELYDEHEKLKEMYKLIAHQTTHFLEQVNEGYEQRSETERFYIERGEN